MNTTEYYNAIATDPAFRLQNATKNASPVEAGSTGLMWSSASPDYGYYNLGSGWNELDTADLSDPTVAKLVADQAHNSAAGPSTGYWNDMGNLIPEGVGLGPNETGSLMTGIGTKFSIAPDVGGEEELAKKLGGMWTPQPMPQPIK